MAGAKSLYTKKAPLFVEHGGKNRLLKMTSNDVMRQFTCILLNHV